MLDPLAGLRPCGGVWNKWADSVYRRTADFGDRLRSAGYVVELRRLTPRHGERYFLVGFDADLGRAYRIAASVLGRSAAAVPSRPGAVPDDPPDRWARPEDAAQLLLARLGTGQLEAAESLGDGWTGTLEELVAVVERLA